MRDKKKGTGLVLESVRDIPGPPDVSVIVPVTERPAPLGDLYLEYSAALAASDRAYEFLFVVEPAFREAVEPLQSLAVRGEPIRIIEASHSPGESTLLKLGAQRASGRTLLVLPSYHRVVPEALPRLLDEVESGADLVNARRWPRRDSLVNRWQTRIFHTLVAGMSSGIVRDVASGVRAMHPRVLREVPLYGDFFRFLPLLALREGFSVTEIDCAQHPRDARLRVYTPGTYFRRAIDVFGLFFLTRFTYKPLRFFGIIGSLLSAVGTAMLLVMFVQRLGGQGLANRPLLLLAVLLFTLGVQAVALGLIGEIIVHFNAPNRRPYRIAGDQEVPGEGSEPDRSAEDDDDDRDTSSEVARTQ